MRLPVGSSLVTILTGASYIVAAVALMSMMMVVVANIIGRIFFSSPVTGTLEIAGFAGVVVASIAIVFAERGHRNVVVDIIMIRLPLWLQRIFKSITYLLSFIAIGILFWAVFKYAVEWFRTGEATLTMSIPHFPFGFIWAGALFCLCAFLLKHLIQTMTRRVGK